MQLSSANSSVTIRRAGDAVAILLAVLLTISGHAPSAIADPVEIHLPLDSDDAYEVDKLLEQCNHVLGTQYPIEFHRGRKQVLSPSERIALLLANEWGLVDAQVTRDHISLKFRAVDNAQRRQETRQRLARWLEIPADYWGANHGLQISTDFDPARRTLLVIHGLEATQADLGPFVRACRATNIQLLTFSYPNDGPLASAGQRLHQELHKLIRKHPQLQITVVGLSMGGLVGRYALEAAEKESCGVTDLFLVGTPNHGSALASELGFLELVFQVLPGGIKGIPAAFADGLGEAADDLRPCSEFLASLNALPRAANVRYHVGIGTRSFVAAEQRERVLADMERIFSKRKASKTLQQELRGLLAAEELQDGTGDGAVTVRSAGLPGCHSERRFPLNHAQLLSLPDSQPEESEVFQWILSEMDWDSKLSGETATHE